MLGVDLPTSMLGIRDPMIFLVYASSFVLNFTAFILSRLVVWTASKFSELRLGVDISHAATGATALNA